MKNVQELLRRLTADVPPDQGRKHCFLLNADGALEVSLAVGGKFLPATFEEGDYDKDVDTLAYEIRMAAAGALIMLQLEKGPETAAEVTKENG